MWFSNYSQLLFYLARLNVCIKQKDNRYHLSQSLCLDMQEVRIALIL